jgi:hypothetical protein
MSFPIIVSSLRAPVMGQLKNALPRKGRFALIKRILRGIIRQKVKREFSFFKVPFLDESHAHDVAVEFERFRGVLDAEHGVVEDVGAGVCVGRHGGGRIAMCECCEGLSADGAGEIPG